MGAMRNFCCSHRNTAVALVVVCFWAIFSTLKLVSRSESFSNALDLSTIINKWSLSGTLSADSWSDHKTLLGSPEDIANTTEVIYNKYINPRPLDNYASCNNTGLPGPQDSVWLALRWRTSPARWVVYNRVPKTGSSLTKAVIRALSKVNKFKTVSSNVNVFFNVSLPRQEAFVQEFYQYTQPVVYDRHIYFIDFNRFGEDQPMYINTVRDPISHYLSFYYFMRQMSHWKMRYSTITRTMNLTACLNRSAMHCEPHRQYRFYCGQDPICSTLTYEKDALALAKRNIERHYALVGLSEDLSGFFSTLEVLAPHYFRGATAMHRRHKNDYTHFTTKRIQPTLEPATRELLKNVLQYDYELYEFAKQRFYKQKCLVQNIRKHNL